MESHLELLSRVGDTVAAHAPRTDVLFDTGTGNVPHDANGVGWYYNGNWSWGFAPQGATGALDNSTGVREFVVGTGGVSLAGTSSPITNSQVLQNTTFGVLELLLHATSYDWRFVPEAGKTFTDSGSTACH